MKAIMRMYVRQVRELSNLALKNFYLIGGKKPEEKWLILEVSD